MHLRIELSVRQFRFKLDESHSWEHIFILFHNKIYFITVTLISFILTIYIGGYQTSSVYIFVEKYLN